MTVLLSETEQCALTDLKSRIRTICPVEAYSLFGSKVTGRWTEESDIDLLIEIDLPLTTALKGQILEQVFLVNLEYNTGYSVIIVEHNRWIKGPLSYSSLHRCIKKEGVVV